MNLSPVYLKYDSEKLRSRTRGKFFPATNLSFLFKVNNEQCGGIIHGTLKMREAVRITKFLASDQISPKSVPRVT